jgi:muramoyltetrapeptide carboxypeptidase
MHFSALPPYSERAMIAALTAMEPLGRLEAFGHWQTLRGAGPVQGRLLGGHLGTIRVLLGTPFAPDWDGAVLFIEEIDCELHDVDAALTHFRLAGVLDRIAALVVGRCVNVAERWRPSVETVHDVVLRCCEGTDFPILADVDLGHTDERLTLPIGALATVYPAESAISVDEAVVACPL